MISVNLRSIDDPSIIQVVAAINRGAMTKLLSPLALIRCCFWWILFVPGIDSLATPHRSMQKNSAIDDSMSRRDALFVGSAVAATTFAVPRISHAASGEVTSVTDLLARIKGVPTFCIVDKDGASYMIVKADERMAKGYAFTTFEGALAALADAQRTAQEKGYPELWEDATITTIPADAAVRLSLTKKERSSQKNQSLDSIMMIIPSAVRTWSWIICVVML